VTAQIEACLNSRPLTQASNDPSDLTVLTPGHFLIGDLLTAVPDEVLIETRMNRLSRWQLVQQMAQHFWKRWSSEFLTRLQQRPKWLQGRRDFRVNDVVLIKDAVLPPLKWKLGRILIVHPGEDGIVRVVTLKTADGTLKRPVVKICLLPIIDDDEISDSDNNSNNDVI